MWSVALPQAERGSQVAFQKRLLLDTSKDRLVYRLLVVCTTRCKFFLLWYVSLDRWTRKPFPPYLRFLALLEERLLTLLVLGLIPSEVLLSRYFFEHLLVNVLDVYSCRGRDDVAVVDTAERNAIDLERAGDEENALVEVVEENDALAPEAASEED